ncbi:hypothetical protein DPMN_127320 [Dreissena polymorpha]|uniref:Uncharacterized protein n=1 Tax=Dreissena polymorpha TaxID=45954 RepID=A0A9D4GYR9_DREPO|nr:hypothetical protein DPMN_127320 [Dreissena polymorpha]
MGVNVSRNSVLSCELLIVKDTTPEADLQCEIVQEFVREVYVSYSIRVVRTIDFNPTLAFFCRKILFFLNAETDAISHQVPVWLTSLPHFDHKRRGGYLILELDEECNDSDAGFFETVYRNGIAFNRVVITNHHLVFQWWPLVLRFLTPRPKMTSAPGAFTSILFSEAFIDDKAVHSGDEADSLVKSSVHEQFFAKLRNNRHVHVYWSGACHPSNPEARMVMIYTSLELDITVLRKFIREQPRDAFLILDFDIEDEHVDRLPIKVYKLSEHVKGIFNIMLKAQMICPRHPLRTPLMPVGPLKVSKDRTAQHADGLRIFVWLIWTQYPKDKINSVLRDCRLVVERIGTEADDAWKVVAKQQPCTCRKFEDHVIFSGGYKYRICAENAWGVASEYLVSDWLTV